MLETGLAEVSVLRPVADDVVVASLAGGLQRLIAMVHDYVVRPGLPELGADALADAAVAADDHVLSQSGVRSLPPSLSPGPRQDPTGDDLDERAGDVEKDCHAGEEHDDGEQLAGGPLGPRVETGEGRRDDRPVERSNPPFVGDEMEAERGESQDRDEGGQREPEPAEADASLHEAVS